MRYILIDEIPEADIQKLRKYLDNQALKSGLDDLYWAELPENLLTSTQAEHHSCKPYVFGLELNGQRLKAELFIRNRKHFNCPCQKYGNEQQRRYIVDYVFNIVAELHIRT